MTSYAVLLALQCLSAPAQTTEDAIKARLIGQPLFLRDSWMEDSLRFGGDGQPEKNYKMGSFTVAGIDVRKVKLSHGELHLEGQRIGLEFPKVKPNSAIDIPKRVALSGNGYDGTVRIDIQSPTDGDFDKALTAIFAPDLASLAPGMPSYWQHFARAHFLTGTVNDAVGPSTAEVAAKKQQPSPATHGAVLPVGGEIRKPTVVDQQEPHPSEAARLLKYSGNVDVFLWVLPDGTPSHLSIVKPAGLGLDEQAILAVSKYRFKPALKDGKPVTVDLYVDVNFQIYE